MWTLCVLLVSLLLPSYHIFRLISSMKNGIQPAKILSLTSRKNDSNSKQKYDKLETCKQHGNSTTRMMVYPAFWTRCLAAVMPSILRDISLGFHSWPYMAVVAFPQQMPGIVRGIVHEWLTVDWINRHMHVVFCVQCHWYIYIYIYNIYIYIYYYHIVYVPKNK